MKYLNTKKGFTLIELIVAMGLFAFVAVISTSVMIAVIDGNKKVRSSTLAVDSLRFALDSMTREMRVGSNFECNGNAGVDLTVMEDTADCARGAIIGFQTSELAFMQYKFESNKLQRKLNAGAWIDLTGDSTVLTRADFYVRGSTVGDTEQPLITIVLEGYVGLDPDTGSTFELQTAVAQRFPDF